MKKYVLVAFVSAGLGSLIARTFQDFGVAVPVRAQQTIQPPSLDWPPKAPGGLPTVDIRYDQSNTTGEGLTSEERVNISVYERANRGVVNIETRFARRYANSPFLMSEEPATGSGSGSIVDREGHVLTNYHVIEDARSAMVTLFDGKSYPADLVGADPTNDIAILKIDAPQTALFPIDLGSSKGLLVGQKVFAIGNPFGLERTLTVGILSSLNRSLPSKTGRTMKHILQIDAALNRGNSGGPLLDSRARLIGMNTAIASPSGTGENTGIGFAIPASTLQRVVPELIQHGRVTRADAGIAQVFETKVGLVVTQLTPDGPAERAGIRGFRLVRERTRRGPAVIVQTYVDRSEADIIVAVDSQPVSTAEEFLELVERHRPGEEAVFTLIRDDRQVDVSVVLGEDS